MFGYVRVNKPEMKVKEYETYRGLYCSLCKSMRKNFGILSTLTLSYDMTFFLLARLSFAGALPHFEGGRCQYNPTKKCSYCRNQDKELTYAAAVSLMLFYFKVRDNISDSTFFRGLLMYLILPYASLKYKKAKKLYPEAAEVIEKNMLLQYKTEKNSCTVTDEAAHPSADCLGLLLSRDTDSEGEHIYRFGYAVGKWVYLCDALEDIEDDIKKGSYNVFVNKYFLSRQPDEQTRAQIKGSLNMCLAMVWESYGQINNKSLTPIMENIIYEGMEIIMNNILKGTKENERSL